MLAGRLPFEAETIRGLARKVAAAEVAYPRAMPRGAVDLLRGILVADPRRRHTMQQIREHAWLAPAAGAAVRRMRDAGDDCCPTAFEIVARLMCSPGVVAFGAHRARRRVLETIGAIVEQRGAVVVEVRDLHSMIVSWKVVGAVVGMRLDVLPIDPESAIVVGCPIEGSDVMFRNFFDSIKRSVCL
jgi:hypothetical protein